MSEMEGGGWFAKREVGVKVLSYRRRREEMDVRVGEGISPVLGKAR